MANSLYDLDHGIAFGMVRPVSIRTKPLVRVSITPVGRLDAVNWLPVTAWVGDYYVSQDGTLNANHPRARLAKALALDHRMTIKRDEQQATDEGERR